MWHFNDGREQRIRVAKNLKNANLNLIQKLEVFWGLASKNLNILNPNYPQNLILNLKNAVFILTSIFEGFLRVLKKPQLFGGIHKLSKQEGVGGWSVKCL